MDAWQKITVIGIGLITALAAQIFVKDPTARSTLTGLATGLVGWMIPRPGDVPATPAIPRPSKVPEFPNIPKGDS